MAMTSGEQHPHDSKLDQLRMLLKPWQPHLPAPNSLLTSQALLE